LAVAAGAGALPLAEFLARAGSRWHPTPAQRSTTYSRFLSFVICHLSSVILLFPWPFYQAALNLQQGISLRHFAAAEEYVAAVHRRFAGRGERAVLLSDWEHLTPLWVHAYTEGEDLDQADVERVYVSTAIPWSEAVWAHIDQGPIYLPDYRPPVRDAGFRLVPEGPFYRVVAPPVTRAAPTHPLALDARADGRVHILGYDLPSDTVRAGQPLELILYQSTAEPIEGIWMPYARLGPVEARWTTDSRLLTPDWLPGEIVVERYTVPVPFTLPPSGENTLELATITVLPGTGAPPAVVLEQALANLDNQVALMGARSRAGRARKAPWDEPLVVQAGRPLHLTLIWRALASPRHSYTIFIHLIDRAGRPVMVHDYTPLGGACPTYLWFPKWLPGQVLTDPYRLIIPSDLPAGDYWLEVGMYGMTSLRRLPVVDLGGNLAGDRVILGPVRVE
jgi:hypothetical protein